MMTITTQARVLLLLTARLGQAEDASPLDRSGLDRLCAWLKRSRLKPVDLLEPELLERLSRAPGAPSPDRLGSLLNRSALLDAVLDRWERSGLWVMGRDDPDYPRRVKRRLGDAAPALLFGRGDRRLLNRGGIAVVGGAGDADASGYAERFAIRAAMAGLSIISGLRNPVEEAAVLGGLSRGGFAIGVLPGELRGQAADARLCTSADRLVLVSEAEPGHGSGGHGSGGHAGGGATRCVYGVSDAALLVGVERGGNRWADTVSAIEKEWVPHWVRAGDPDAGTLIRLGARPIDEEAGPRALLSPPRPARSSTRMSSTHTMPGSIAPSLVPQPVLAGFAEAATPFPAPPTERGGHLRLVEAGPRPASREPARPDPGPRFPEPSFPGPSFYELFGRRVALLLRSGPLGAVRIAEVMELTRPQADAWLLRAQGDGLVRLDPGNRLYHLP